MVSYEDPGHKFAKVWVEFDLHHALVQDWYMGNVAAQDEVWFHAGKLCGTGDSRLWYYMAYVESREKFTLAMWKKIVSGSQADLKIHVWECQQDWPEAQWELNHRECPTTAQFDSTIGNIKVYQTDVTGHPEQDFARFTDYSKGNSRIFRWEDWRLIQDQEEEDHEQSDWNICG